MQLAHVRSYLSPAQTVRRSSIHRRPQPGFFCIASFVLPTLPVIYRATVPEARLSQGHMSVLKGCHQSSRRIGKEKQQHMFARYALDHHNPKAFAAFVSPL